MATPFSPKTELFISGVGWVDATTAHPANTVRGEGGTAGITITRGVADQQSRISPATSTFTLNNRGGIWSSRNPLSPYYGLITRNVGVRHSVGPADTYLKFPSDSTTGYVYTTDKAVLDTAGDFDMRIEIEPKSWRPQSSLILASKWATTGNNRAWHLRLNTDGRIILIHCADGTAATIGTTGPTQTIPATSGRLAVRAVWDVDNGSGGRTFTVYTSSSINGTWTLLGSATQVGTTTTYAGGTANLAIGAESNGGTTYTGIRPFWGKIYAFQWRDAAGVLRAETSTALHAMEVTSFADALGNTWLLSGAARIASDRIRYRGELSELPTRWDKSGADVYMPVVAAGLLRRLGQGAQALHSPLYRSLSGFGGIAGYWPLEDGSSATQGVNLAPGGTPATGIDLTFGASQASTLAGSEGAVAFNSATSRLRGLTAYLAPTGTVGLLFYFRMASLPATDVLLFRLYLDGYWDIKVGPTGWTFEGYNPAGALLATAVIGFGAGGSPLNNWVGMRLTFSQEGANIRWQTSWYGVGTTAFWTHSAGGSTYAGTLGRASGYQTSANTAFIDMAFAHILITQNFLDLEASLSQTAVGYAGERATTRFARLCTEEGVPYEIDGETQSAELMGPQRSAKLIDLLQDIQDVDMGLFGESRDILALSYRTRADLYGNAPLVLDYSAGVLSEVPNPTDDDRLTENDVTVSRESGSSFRTVIEAGPLSVRDPSDYPPGAGRYQTDVTVNASTDAQLEGLSGWRALLGSIDQVRIPNLDVALHRTAVSGNAALTGDIIATNLGDSITLAAPPFWLGPDDVKLLTFGYTERIGGFLWDQTHNTVPGEPYAVAVYGGGVLPVARYDTEDDFLSYLAGPITSTATTMVITTPCDLPNEARWINSTTHPAEFPLDVTLGGERMTVSAISANEPATDGFTRVTANGWGVANSGQAWTTSGGSASDYSTNGTQGVMNLSTVTTQRTASLGVSLHPFEIFVGTMRYPANLTGAGAQGVLDAVLCQSASNTFIRLRIYQGLVGTTNTCSLEQWVAGVLVAQDTAFPSVGLVATTAMSARVQVFGDFARARVWQSGTVEPLGAWQTSLVLPAAGQPGTIGFAASVNASTTNVPPFNAVFDDLGTQRAQTFTMSARSVNGVVKAQTSGDVHVADDAHYGL